MKTNVRKLKLIIALLFAVACGTEGTSFLIDDQTESEIGAEVHQEVLAEYPLYENADVQAWVEDLGGTIAAASVEVRDGVNYQFFVLDSDIVNAFAAPGGYVYLTRGLILAADEEAEVASVLGHEVGHVAHRHGVA
ncbi:MAG: M48 family metalloprotease, partial [Myxococcales bacterium]|nr:M48 family metalloprotease [Myxococcales bacterium]